MILKHKKVAIIGAGPVGLTLATLLQQKGTDVRVYERDKDAQARIWGGTLDLHESSGQMAMKKAGLLESYYAMAKPMGRRICDEQGKVFFSVKPQLDNPEINRNDLRKMLLDSLTGGTVVWDRKFTGLEERNGNGFLQFENGMNVSADVVIGANGGMSGVRKYVTDTEVEETGTCIIQGEVFEPEIRCPEFYQLCDNSIFMSAYNGNLLVANPNNKGLLTYNIIFKKPEDPAYETGPDFRNTERVRTFLLDRLFAWNGLYKQLLRSTSSFWGLPTKKLSLDKPWKTERALPITLVGDAAHLMPPFAGQGVNTGMMDALILCDNLTNGKFATIEAAISDYEQKMFVYAKEAQLETGKNEMEMQKPGFSFKKRFSD